MQFEEINYENNDEDYGFFCNLEEYEVINAPKILNKKNVKPSLINIQFKKHIIVKYVSLLIIICFFTTCLSCIIILCKYRYK